MQEILTYWAPPPELKNGKSSRMAGVAADPLRQIFVEIAINQGYLYPAQFSREAALPQDCLSQFIRGNTVLSPENMLKALQVFEGEGWDILWELYGCEIRKGKGSFVTVRGTARARIAAVNAQASRKIGKINGGNK